MALTTTSSSWLRRRANNERKSTPRPALEPESSTIAARS
jgi:hypothetical protein